jgi:hypothetical protein
LLSRISGISTSFWASKFKLLSSSDMHLSQTKYVHNLLVRTNMHKSKPCTTPMTTSSSLSMHDSPSFDDPHLYRSVVGALQYATLTRPDISFAVNNPNLCTTPPWLIGPRWNEFWGTYMAL